MEQIAKILKFNSNPLISTSYTPRKSNLQKDLRVLLFLENAIRPLLTHYFVFWPIMYFWGIISYLYSCFLFAWGTLDFFSLSDAEIADCKALFNKTIDIIKQILGDNAFFAVNRDNGKVIGKFSGSVYDSISSAVIIDGKTVWYSSGELFYNPDNEECVLRIHDELFAGELYDKLM